LTTRRLGMRAENEKSNETLRAYVRLTPNSGARADIPGPPLWADFVAKVIGAAAES
jgi:hypothetical protein